MTKKLWFRFLISMTSILVCLSLLSSCTGDPDPRAAVSSVLRCEPSSTSGQIYSLDSKEWEDSYLPDDMLLSIYGFDRSTVSISEGAVYLSGFCHPCEIAVFITPDTKSAEDIALYFHNRLRLLSSNAHTAAATAGMTVEEYRRYIDEAVVIIKGRAVALLISGDIAEAKKALYKVI